MLSLKEFLLNYEDDLNKKFLTFQLCLPNSLTKFFKIDFEKKYDRFNIEKNKFDLIHVILNNKPVQHFI